MSKPQILWADDEIDLLKPHIIFLENKGYDVITVNNGEDAYEYVLASPLDLVFLDENMPGLSGLETLNKIKSVRPFLPVVMITKSEAEDIMEAAIGSKISDYLIKPVNPNQILLTIKKNLDNKRLISKETLSSYQSQFNQIGMEINNARHFQEWVDIYKKLVYWDIELESLSDKNLEQILHMQKEEANNGFARFVSKNYVDWLNPKTSDKPVFSHNLVSKYLVPAMEKYEKVFFLVIDNMRYDQWKILQSSFLQYFSVSDEQIYCSILPTATQYARNAIFAGLMPLEISRMHPQFWVEESEDESKNNYEKDLLQKQLSRLGKDVRFNYTKIRNTREGNRFLERFNELKSFDLNVVVYNFIDVISHARTDIEIVRELATNDSAYRSLTKSWFEHSDLKDILEEIAKQDCGVVITTDHGTVQVNNPIKIVGDRNSSTNLRYKQGKNLNMKSGTVFTVSKPQDIHLPSPNISTSYVFATKYNYMLYPNNYNKFVNLYRNSFQHGGISMEEMLIPIIEMIPK